jgi:GT2 family glycosyltransferase
VSPRKRKERKQQDRGSRAERRERNERARRGSAAHGGKKRGGSPSLEVTPGAPLADADLPRVAVVILNLNGRHHLEGCFRSLGQTDYPAQRREVVLVENGSSDGSGAYVTREIPWVRLIENPAHVGFSAGCNQGAAAAGDAEVLVFLNNDMRVEPAFLRELVGPIVRRECQATTGKMLSWDGKLVNSAGGGMNFHGLGIQRGYLAAPDPIYDVPRRTLFACGGAMAIDAAVFRATGGFDEEFFAYYEDVDLGWRLWVQGHAIHYAPDAVCYHHHSSTSKRLPLEMIRLLQVRNPLLACFKNYDEKNLKRILPAMLALAFRRTRVVAGLADEGPFRIERAGGSAMSKGTTADALWRRFFGKDGARIELNRVAVADLLGANDLLGRWEHWMRRRRAVQELRRRDDAEIFELFLKPHWCIEDEAGYRELHRGVTDLFGIDRMFDGLTEPGPEPHR